MNSTKTDWGSIAQVGASLIALVTLWALALGLAFFGMTQVFGGEPSGGMGLLLMAAGTGFSGVLLLPSAGYALASLFGKPQAAIPLLGGCLQPRLLLPSLSLLALPIVLLAGYWAARNELVGWLALPPLHILAIGLPVWWLAALSLRGLPAGSPQRQWGVFGSGLVLGPALILAAELAAMVGMLVLAALWIASDPTLAARIMELAQRLAQGSPDPEEALRLLGPYLVRPEVLLGLLAFGAGIVPLIEEALKPVGVWLLAGRQLSPAEGFAAGVLSGAGYALFESLALASSGEQWALLAAARSGTAGVHILNTGLVGWALVSAWRERRYLRLVLTYLAAVAIHGLWNSLSLILSFSALAEAAGQQARLPGIVWAGRAAPFVLAAIAVGSLIGLIGANRKLGRQGLAEA